ncbi:MAG: outer membrane protein assembly factor BamD [Polyangiales bacterium]
MRTLSRVVVLAVLAVAAPLVACGAGKREYGTGILQYSENARRAYEDALVAFKDKDWQEATTLLRDVRRRFAFSAYAPLAQLRLADVEFAQEKWAESIPAYKAFIRENPKHPDIAWAKMRIARSFFNQISDAFLLPAQETRDQSAVVEASREIDEYLTTFPAGPQYGEMKELSADAKARLVAHELYVARFYMTKDKLEAALARATYAVTHYHGSRRDAEALVVRGEILLMLKRRVEARQTFESVVQRYAGDPRVIQAKNFLAKLDADEH